MNEVASILYAVTSMVGFGLADFFAKIIVSKTSAYRTLLISQTIGSIPFLGLTLLYDFAFPDERLLLLTILSGALSSLYLLSFYKALSLGKASLVSPVSSCLTVVALALSVTVLRERLTLAQALVIAVVLGGILLIALQKGTPRTAASNASIVLSLVVVFGAGTNAIIQKWIVLSGHILLGFLLTRFVMLSVLVAFSPVFYKEKTAAVSTGYSRLALLGLIDVFAFFAWFLGLSKGFVSIVAPITNSSSVITIILAHIFLKERVHLYQRIGIITIILGIALLSAIS